MDECFFWYRLTRVVPDKIRDHKMVVVIVVVVSLYTERMGTRTSGSVFPVDDAETDKACEEWDGR